MYASIAALVLLGLSLAWAALNKSGILASDWYISLILIGLAVMAFWARPRRVVCPPLPRWIVWTVSGILAYLIFQALPLPLPLLSILSPARAQLTKSLTPVLGPVSAAPISVDPAAHILWLLTIAGCAAAFFLVRDLTFRLQNRLFLALLPLLLVTAFEALLGLLQIAGGAEQAVGSYNSRDHYCCILEITLPLALTFGLAFFNNKPALPSIWPALKAASCWLVAALLFLGIVFSLSRAGWIDALVSLLVLAILILFPTTPSTAWRIGILAGFVLIAFALLLIASPGAMLGRLAGTLDSDSNGRIFIWQELMPLTHEFRWFGTGLMGFDPVFLKYQAFVNARRIDFAHNDFLQYLIEMGVIGFLPLMACLAGIVWPMAKGSWTAEFSSPGRAEVRLLLAGSVAGISALFLHSLVDFNLYIPANMLAFAWILGFGSGLAAIFSRKASLPLTGSDES
jgi:O-antigen ligase